MSDRDIVGYSGDWEGEDNPKKVSCQNGYWQGILNIQLEVVLLFRVPWLLDGVHHVLGSFYHIVLGLRDSFVWSVGG